MLFHVVAPGDTLWDISRRYGLSSWTQIYKYDKNKAFRAMRPDPNLIFPGDLIYIPSPQNPRPVRIPFPTSDPPDPIVITANAAKDDVIVKPHEAKQITVSEVKKKKISLSAAADLLAGVLGERRFVFDELVGHFRGGKISAGANITQGICELIQSYGYFASGEKRMGFGKFLRATGSLFNVLPGPTGAKLVEKATKGFEKLPKLRPLAKTLVELARIGAYGDLSALLASLLEGDRHGVCQAGSNLVQALKENPQVASWVALPITEFLVNLLPRKLKVKMGSKMVGRKVPVAGTVVVGIFDIVDIVCEPTDWKKWAGLGSTVAGLFPGIGTAGSVVLDLAILIGTIADEIDKIDFSVS